jgi:hypothetical protein
VAKPDRPFPTFTHQEEHSTMTSEKWANITQEFLATTKMINLSLVKLSYNELPDVDQLFP